LLHFYKYQATGNDFIMLDHFNKDHIALSQDQIANLCHRRFGIGADGLISIHAHERYDFEMKYYNADGKLGSMCGNGGRASIMFAHKLGIIGSKTTFLAYDGQHEGHLAQDLVHLQMGNVSKIQPWEDGFFLDTGSPHVVLISDEMLSDQAIFQKGKQVRYSTDFEPIGGTNVNWLTVNQQALTANVATYERGVEDQTFACGTGVTASALVFHHIKGEKLNNIRTLGGDLQVKFRCVAQGVYTDIFLIGPAKEVFQGSISL